MYSGRATPVTAGCSLSPTISPLSKKLGSSWRSVRDNQQGVAAVTGPCRPITDRRNSTRCPCLAPLQRRWQLNAMDDASCHLSCTRQPSASPQAQTLRRDYRRNSKGTKTAWILQKSSELDVGRRIRQQSLNTETFLTTRVGCCLTWGQE